MRASLVAFPTRRSSDLVDHRLGDALVGAPAKHRLQPRRAVDHRRGEDHRVEGALGGAIVELGQDRAQVGEEDRKSTRLNSSHVSISYAVFCLKKNNTMV